MLDEDQQRVVNAGKGGWAILASPGCGKSTVILYRAARLSEEGGKVLTVTFTNSAARGLRDRYQKMCPSGGAEFCTLHSLALKFANEYPESFPFPLSDNPLAGEGVAAKAAFQATKNQINFKVFTQFVSLQKRKRVTPTEAIRFAEISGKDLDKALGYREYCRLLKNQGVLDFDDLIYYCVEILESRPDIRSKMQVEWLQQDEAQDACELDWRMLQLLSQKHKNVLAVGDPAQNLFSFRGSNSDHLLNMEELFPGTKKLFMGRNYRSTRSIVSYVKNSAPYAEIAEHFEAVSKEEGVEPNVTGYSTDFREAEGVVEKIQKLVPGECAILARTNIALREIESQLIEKNIPYYLLNNEGFWEQSEVREVMSWVRCVQSPVDNFVLSALQTPFHPTQYIKRKLVAQEIRNQITKTGKSAWKLLSEYRGKDDRQTQAVKKFTDAIQRMYAYRSLPAREVVSKVIKDLSALEHYKDESGISPDKDPVASIRELVRISEKHDSLQDFLNYVRKVAGASRNRKGVCLSTVHSFKGKQAPHIFLVSCNEGILPHSKSEDLQGEMNCFYVAVSRPELTLNISYWGAPSRFLTRLTQEPKCDSIDLGVEQ